MAEGLPPRQGSDDEEEDDQDWDGKYHLQPTIPDVGFIFCFQCFFPFSSNFCCTLVVVGDFFLFLRLCAGNVWDVLVSTRRPFASFKTFFLWKDTRSLTFILSSSPKCHLAVASISDQLGCSNFVIYALTFSLFSTNTSCLCAQPNTDSREKQSSITTVRTTRSYLCRCLEFVVIEHQSPSAFSSKRSSPSNNAVSRMHLRESRFDSRGCSSVKQNETFFFAACYDPTDTGNALPLFHGSGRRNKHSQTQEFFPL